MKLFVGSVVIGVVGGIVIALFVAPLMPPEDAAWLTDDEALWKQLRGACQ